MKYHNITKDDMINGEGLRVVLWVSGCEHYCKGCQNPITWDAEDGLEFDEEAEKELFEILSRPYISGITFSGGDPLLHCNRSEVFRLIRKIKEVEPEKTIWLYTGYLYEEVEKYKDLKLIDVLIDGKFVKKLNDSNLYWKGSSNQRTIDVKETCRTEQIVLMKD